MAVYKIPQDVEADDKFLGPLSFKQFLFAGGTLIFGYVTFYTLSQGMWPISFVFAPPALAFAALAFPWSKEQPTELWLAARIRFFLKPHKRIWDQTGVLEFVTITAPKVLHHEYTDGLSQFEVRKRMNALATMIDSRGWAVKNYNPVAMTQAPQIIEPSDRLVEAAAPVMTELQAISESTPDIMEARSAVSQQLDAMIKQSEEHHRIETLEMLEKARHEATQPAEETVQTNIPSNLQAPVMPITAPAPPQKGEQKSDDFWFLQTSNQQPDEATIAAAQMQVSPFSSVPAATIPSVTRQDEEAFLETVHRRQEQERLRGGHHNVRGKVIQPLGEQQAVQQPTNLTPAMQLQSPEFLPPATMQAATPTQPPTAPSSYQQPVYQPPVPVPQQATPPVTQAQNPDILNLAKNNDLNVATLSREANKNHNLPPDEVVVSLH